MLKLCLNMFQYVYVQLSLNMLIVNNLIKNNNNEQSKDDVSKENTKEVTYH